MLSEKKRQKNMSNLGNALKEARTKEDYTQKALADAIGLEYYTMISQMELGYISIPPSLWTPIANTLRMDRVRWVLECLIEIQPEVYHALFGIKSLDEVYQALIKLEKGHDHVG